MHDHPLRQPGLHALGPQQFIPELEFLALADEHYLLAESRVFPQGVGQQHTAVSIDFDLGGMTNQQPLDTSGSGIETGQCFDLFFDLLPFGERVNQQAGLIGIDGYN